MYSLIYVTSRFLGATRLKVEGATPTSRITTWTLPHIATNRCAYLTHPALLRQLVDHCRLSWAARMEVEGSSPAS